MVLVKDVSTVALWPWMFIQTQMAFAEVVMSAPVVIGARLSLMGNTTGAFSPANMQEFTGMFTEKVQAFDRSRHMIQASVRTVQKVGDAHVRDLRKISGGGTLWPTDLGAIFERNMRLFATLVMLSGEALAPVHKRVTANARRLSG